MTKFAKTMGVSINTMSAALKFAGLPESIKAYANTRAFFNYKKSKKQGKSSNQNKEVRDLLSYGILCQVSRLHQAGEDEFSLIQWCIRCLVKNYTVEEFKKIVQAYLQRKDNASVSKPVIFLKRNIKGYIAPGVNHSKPKKISSMVNVRIIIVNQK
jgi:hypothetical protein